MLAETRVSGLKPGHDSPQKPSWLFTKAFWFAQNVLSQTKALTLHLSKNM